jgi:hypothetical protein
MYILYHFIREQFEDGKNDISYISTYNRLEDIITKAFSHDKFVCLHNHIIITSLKYVQNSTWYQYNHKHHQRCYENLASQATK